MSYLAERREDEERASTAEILDAAEALYIEKAGTGSLWNGWRATRACHVPWSTCTSATRKTLLFGHR